MVWIGSIPEKGTFALSANVTSPGYQSVVLRGYVYERRDGELWAAPLIPQLFYGADSSQLTTWRQYLPTAGEQTILSRVAGKPEVPREELFWRKISDEEVKELEVVPEFPDWWPYAALALGLIPVIVVGYLALTGGEG